MILAYYNWLSIKRIVRKAGLMSKEIEELKSTLELLPDDEERSMAIVNYLEARRLNGTLENLAEGSVAALVNLLPPRTRAALTANAMRLPMALAAQQVQNLRSVQQPQGEAA